MSHGCRMGCRTACQNPQPSARVADMSAARHIAAADREIFTFSRLAEFCTLRELEKQTGHDANDWPIYIVKELLDNALDAAEEAGIAPQVEIELGNCQIVVADNARGIAAETVKRLLDLGSRTSARARYVSPSRGAQGQALSTILVMPHALDPGGNGAVVIEAHGIAHRISVHVDKLSEEPRLIHERAASSVKNGTRITIEWPQSASTILADNEEQILPLLSAYALANPHLGLTLRRPDNDPEVWSAIDPDWQKWRTCDPTSAHWYRPEDFARLVAAYIQQDQAADRRRPLREFLALFDGLASTTRRGKILTEIGLGRAVLADLLRDGAPDREAIDALLQAMRAETKPVKPARLGIIGETNLRRRLGAFGDADSFRYARAIGFDHEGLPYVVEGAFVWTPNQTHRQLILGANFASAPSLSIDLGPVETVGTLLAERHAGQDEPVAALLHVVHPRPTFTDLGKTQLSLPLRGASGICAKWSRRSALNGTSSASGKSATGGP